MSHSTGALAPYEHFNPDAPILTEAKNQNVRLFWSQGQETGLDAAVAVIDKVNTEMGANVFIHGLIVTMTEDGKWTCEATVS